MVNVLRQNFKNLAQDQGLLQDHRFLQAYRQNRNLCDVVVNAKLPVLTQSKSRAFSSFFKHLDWLCSHYNKNVFPSLCRGSPHPKNCTYVFSCSICGMQYVGETGNTIFVRFTQHRYNVTKQKNEDTYLVQHFISFSWDSVKATNRSHKGGEKKRSWIEKLDTRHPRGLNEKMAALLL